MDFNGKGAAKIPSLQEDYLRLIEIAKLFGVHDPADPAYLDEMSRFRLSVQLIGPYHSGKSSLLNALLGANILPCGLGESLGVAVELSYGENLVLVQRDRFSQRFGLGDLRRGIDMDGVTRMEVHCDVPALRSLSKLLLIDTPGLDSSAASRCQQDGLPYSLAYLLVFPADEPVVKESAAAVLAELRLRDAPVFAVLTKTDKVPAGELASSRLYLKQQLEQLLGRSQVPLACVTVRQPDGLAPFLEILSQLEAQADDTARQRFTARLLERCRQVHHFISMRLAFEDLSMPELNGRIQALEDSVEQIRRLLDQGESGFLAQSQQCCSLMRQRAVGRLDGVCSPIENMLLSGQDPASYIEGMLRGGITADIVAQFEPMAREYIRQAVSTLEVQPLDEQRQGGAVERLRNFAHSVRKPRAILGDLEPIEAVFPIFESPLAPSGGFWGARQRQAELRKQIWQDILPALNQAAMQYIDKLVEERTQLICRTVRDALDEEAALCRRALEDICFRRDHADTRRQHDREQALESLAALETILANHQPLEGVAS